MKFEYHTEGTCSRNIILEMDGDTIQSVQFIGGCNGNLRDRRHRMSSRKFRASPAVLNPPPARTSSLWLYRHTWNKDNFLYTTTDTIKRRGLCD